MFTLDDIKKGITEFEIVQYGKENVFTRASIDTRKIGKRELYFAMVGHNNDGHDYVEAAIKAGAAGVVVSKDVSIVNNDVWIIKVPDTLIALQELAKAVRNRFSVKVIGITGSAGKTTTKDMVAYVLGKKFKTQKSQASYNNHFGVPLTLLDVEEDTTHLIVEMGSNHEGEIDALSKIATPHIGIVTNVGYAHIGNFGSLNDTLQEKTSMVNNLKENGIFIFNGDNELLQAKASDLEGNRDCKLISVGFGEACSYRAVETKSTITGTIGMIQYLDKKVHFEISLVGQHNVYAALIAVASAVNCGISLEEACAELKTFPAPAGRLDVRKISDKLYVIDDSYNSSPDAMFAALRSLNLFDFPIKIAVLGEMKELGDFSKECHEIAGREAFKAATDLIVIGEEGQHVVNSAIKEGFNKDRIILADSATQAVLKVKEIIEKYPDSEILVLTKGSRFTHMERVLVGLLGKDISCNLGVCSKYIHCKECAQV